MTLIYVLDSASVCVFICNVQYFSKSLVSIVRSDIMDFLQCNTRYAQRPLRVLYKWRANYRQLNVIWYKHSDMVNQAQRSSIRSRLK